MSKVLVVDDDPALAEMLGIVLRQEGLDAAFVADGDAALGAFRRERPDLDTAPMEVLSRISRLAHHLDRRRAGTFGAHGLESWEFDVLAALRRAGEPYELSPGRLLRETLVTSGTMTNRVDRLAGRGLVERLPDPHDRRGVLVRLTADGKANVDGAFEAVGAGGERAGQLADEQAVAARSRLAQPEQHPGEAAVRPRQQGEAAGLRRELRRMGIGGLARIEAYYFAHDLFLPPEGLLGHMHRIGHLPAEIVQGRYDMVCPARTAFELAAAWPQARLTVVPDAGHSALEPGVRRALVSAVERFRSVR